VKKPWLKGGKGKYGSNSKSGPDCARTVRARQTLSTYGPGSLIDLLTEAVLVGGLDFWRYTSDSEAFIEEPRLRDVAAKRFRQGNGGALSQDHAFRRPPRSEERQYSPAQGIQVLQFPAWFVCQPCRALASNMDLLDQKQAPYNHQCDRGGPGRCCPRFLLACKHGHVEDFRWVRFARQDQENACSYPSLRLEEGPSGDVSEIFVRCLSCNAPPRPLVRAYATGANGICDGRQPWLGRDIDTECKEPLRLLSRSASNGYFAQVVRGLSIPDPGRALHEAVSTSWTAVHAVETAADLTYVRKITNGKLKGYSDEAIIGAVEAIRTKTPPPVAPIRSAEWRSLVSQPIEKAGDMPAPRLSFFARALPPAGNLPASVAKVILVPRLREVRVQVGFTRLEAPAPISRASSTSA
jgi:hypothetical protein